MSELRTQSKRASFAEACANTAIGFIISWGATLTCMWLLNFTMSFVQLWWYTVFMTVVSVARGYVLRRMWNAEWWKKFKRKHADYEPHPGPQSDFWYEEQAPITKKQWNNLGKRNHS